MDGVGGGSPKKGPERGDARRGEGRARRKENGARSKEEESVLSLTHQRGEEEKFQAQFTYLYMCR